MKSGVSKKKLVLKKISIANLDKDKTHEVKGGLPPIKDDFFAYMVQSPHTCVTVNPPCPVAISNCVQCIFE